MLRIPCCGEGRTAMKSRFLTPNNSMGGVGGYSDADSQKSTSPVLFDIAGSDTHTNLEKVDFQVSFNIISLLFIFSRQHKPHNDYKLIWSVLLMEQLQNK